MLLSHFKRLCICSATLIAASPLATIASRAVPLPSALQQGVPSCAHSCLQISLAEKFPVACTGSDSIQCLCSRYSNTGESLGEVALGCVYSACSVNDPGAGAAYNVCIGQRDFVMPTQTAISMPSSPPRTTSTSSTSKPLTTSIVTTTRSQTSSTRSIIVDSISETPSATSSPTAVPASADTPPRMTPAQIAGLSVAAVAAFAMAIGLMALSVCLRRRRERKNAFDSDEKNPGRKSKKYSSRFSHYVTVGSQPEPPKRFPMTLPAVARRDSDRPGASNQQDNTHLAVPYRAVQRNGVGTSNSSSNSSLPLDQIGVAISAELDGTSAAPRTTTNANAQLQQTKIDRSNPNVPFRPISAMTQETVFEEDEMAPRRRSSVLLPTPPVPIPPIRSLQASKRASTFDNATTTPLMSKQKNKQQSRRSELFLNIPVRHERPQPKRVVIAELSAANSPKRNPPAQVNRLAPPIQIASSSSPQRTPGSSTTEDIDDYYFTAHKEPTPRASPAYKLGSNNSSNTVHVRPKRSGSTVTRTASRASTNVRDSVSSQTSFETVDANDPTPDDDDEDKQLSDDSQLSPVAESPISKLRYPKVPRASNQLVPRSPRSPQNYNSLSPTKNQPTPWRNQPSPPRNQPTPPRNQPTPTRNQPSPPTSHLLQHRRKDLAPPLLESRLPLRLNAPKDMALVAEPLKDPFTSPPRIRLARAHIRSNSTESWSTTPRSKIDRKSRTQSGMWPSSPAMYDEPEVIQPLNVKRKEGALSARRNRDEMKEINVGRDVDHDVEVNGMKSPVWVPRLTPTRKGDDLFISVGWGGR